jgi:hypothetical protein
MIMAEATTQETSSEIVRATPRARLLLSLLLLLALLFFLVCQFAAIPFLIKTLNTTPLSSASKVAIKSMLAGFASIAMLAGLWTTFHGRAIWRDGRYPPARAWVWRDTPVKRGKIAVRFACLHIAIGTLICLIGLGCSLYLWRLVDRAIPHTNRPFIILKQETITPHAPAQPTKP